jgi:hypothetical protein
MAATTARDSFATGRQLPADGNLCGPIDEAMVGGIADEIVAQTCRGPARPTQLNAAVQPSAGAAGIPRPTSIGWP